MVRTAKSGGSDRGFRLILFLQELRQWDRFRRPENLSDVAEVFLPQHTEKQSVDRRNILFVQRVQRVAQLCQQAMSLRQVRGLDRPGPVDDPPIGSEVIVPVAQVHALQTAVFDIRHMNVAPQGFHDGHNAIPGSRHARDLHLYQVPGAEGDREGRKASVAAVNAFGLIANAQLFVPVFPDKLQIPGIEILYDDLSVHQ